MSRRYTRQELEQLLLPRPLWVEGMGLHQLQWGGWEVAAHIHNGRLCIKHEPQGDGLLLELYDKCWTAWDGPPEGEGGT